MNRATLLDKLDRATTKLASFAVVRGYPLTMPDKSTLIGRTFIKKTDCNTYNILSSSKEILYKDISAFDIAVIIAQRHNLGETLSIRKVLLLEASFSKHHTDMMHYLHCIRRAKKDRDTMRMAILEDKFQISEIMAKKIRDSIARFKRVKT